MISGVSLEGTHYFYDNPLASEGEHHRQDWFGCACCPPNFARLLASLGDYIYAQSDTGGGGTPVCRGRGALLFGGRQVTLRSQRRLSVGRRGSLRIDVEQPARFGLRLRLPGWCAEPRCAINGAAGGPHGSVESGYARIERQWQQRRYGRARSADDGPAPVRPSRDSRRRRTGRDPARAADLLPGRRRQRCRRSTRWGCRATPSSKHAGEAELLGGVVTLSGTAARDEQEDWTELYRAAPPRQVDTTIVAVPYYAWDNRDPGPMAVWIRESWRS